MLAAAFFAPQLTIAAKSLFEREGGPGGAIGVVQNGNLIYVEPFGVRSLTSKKPVDDQTRFEIGSVTKMFTAAAVLQLKERGKLSIDGPLSKYVPSFPHASEITLRQLLTHTSGLPEYDTMDDFVDRMASIPNALPDIEAFAQGPLNFKPGTKWEYSNTNYIALGLVIAAVSGETYENYVRANLFAPAGMVHSGFISDESRMTDFAIPYWKGPHDKVPLQPAPKIYQSWAGGAGSIVSTVGDLAAWDVALMNGKVATMDDFTLMSTPARLTNGTHTDYGMGLGVGVLDDHKRVGHRGETNGSASADGIYPADRTAIIVLENFVPTSSPSTFERIALDEIFQDAGAAARRAAPGEDYSMRPLVIGLIAAILNGTIRPSQMTPEMAAFFTPKLRKSIAAHFAPLGMMKSEIFERKTLDGKQTWYVYRIEFEHGVEMCSIAIDNATHVVTDSNVQPGG